LSIIQEQGTYIVPPKPLPILSFPKAVIDASRGGVVIHFQCMGTKDGEAFVSTFAGAALKKSILRRKKADYL